MTLPDPTPVDYSSRDYASIRDDLIDLIPSFVPEWTSRNSSDFGIVLLQLFAYVADSLNYYADRSANEAFLETATQRGSVIRLARLLGYNPTSTLAATTDLTFSNSTGADITVPAGSQVSTTPTDSDSTPITFETDEDLVVPATSSATVGATEGTTVSDEQVGVSDGSVDQTFALFNPDVIQGSVQVFVDGVEWNPADHLITCGPYDTCVGFLLDENDVTSLVFGDGANGVVPAAGAIITATYRVGGGAAGNVAANTLVNIIDSLPAGLTVLNNSAATGGADSETTDSIRVNASKQFSTNQRAVTLDDYANLAVGVPGVGKASAVSGSLNSVTSYVVPQGGGGVDEGGDPTTQLAALLVTVQETLAAAAPASASVTVLPSTYVPINVTVTVHASNTYRQDRVQSDATSALTDLFDIDNVILGDQITVADIQLAMAGVVGAAWTDISVLDRDDGTGFSNQISLDSNECPVLGTLTVTVAGGIS